MYITIVTLLLGFGMYQLANTFIILPSRQSIKSAKRLQEKRKLSDDLSAFFVDPISKLLVKVINLDSRKREKMQRNLERVNIPKTPEKFYADALVISFWILAFGLVWIVVGIPFLLIVCVVTAVWLFTENISLLRKKVSKIEEAIRNDMPKFVSIYNHARGDNVNLVDIVEKYRRTACEEFHYDLDLLIMDLKTGNEEIALQDFAARISITQLDHFVNILIGSSKGEDMTNSLILMENEMSVLMIENKRRKLQRLPDKVRGATIATGISLVALVITPIIIDLVKSLSAF